MTEKHMEAVGVGDYLFRYTDTRTIAGVMVNFLQYRIDRKTACGAWVSMGYGTEKFIKLSAQRPGAYPSKEEALSAFISRKKRQISILESRLEDAMRAKAKAEWMQKSKEEAG